MLPNYLANIKSAGIYRFVWDKSEMPGQQAQILRLVVGYSEKGPFNTPVYVRNEQEFKQIFGGKSKKLERYGVWFHRMAVEALKGGPILALNIKNFENPYKEGTDKYDDFDNEFNRVDFATFNPQESIFRMDLGEGTILDNLNMKVSELYNTDRFWKLEPEHLEDLVDDGVIDTDQAGYITITSTDSKDTSVSIFMRGYEPTGYDVTFKEWYSSVLNGEDLPAYMEGYENELVSHYFAQIYIFKGKFTPEIAASDKLSKFFVINQTDNGPIVSLKPYIENAFGEKIDTLEALANNDASNFVKSYSGILLPDFRDANNMVISLDSLVNGDNYLHKLMMRLNQTMLWEGDITLDEIDTTGWYITSEGHNSAPMNFFDIMPIIYIGDWDSSSRIWNWEPVSESMNGMNPQAYGWNVGAQGPEFQGNRMEITESASVQGGHIEAYDALNLQVGDSFAASTQGGHRTGIMHITDIQKDTYEQPSQWWTVNGEGHYENEPMVYDIQPSTNIVKYKDPDSKEIVCDLDGPQWDPQNSVTFYALKVISSGSSYFAQGDTFRALWDGGASASCMTPGETSSWTPYKEDMTPYDFNLTTLSFELYKYAINTKYWGYDEETHEVSAQILSLPNENDPNWRLRVFTQNPAVTDTGLLMGGDIMVVQSGDAESIEYFIQQRKIMADRTSYFRGGMETPLEISGYEQFQVLGNWYRVDYSEPAFTDYALYVNEPSIENREGSETFNRLIITFDSEFPENDPIESFIHLVHSFTTGSVGLVPLYLEGYTFGNPKPESTSQIDKLNWQHNIFDALTNYRGLRTALTNRVDIDYRYLVDTFESFVEPECKAVLANLCKEKDNVFGLLNFPKMVSFSKCKYTSFRNEKNEFLTKYIPMGGNPMKPMAKVFSLPSQENGASWVGFFSALALRDGDTGVREEIPSAALVSNDFMEKYTRFHPYTIIAGPNRSVIRETGLIGPDFNFGRDDLDALEPFGVNCMVYEPRKGTYINANQTAKQNPVTALSRIHVRELVIYLQDEIEKLMTDYHWDFNTPNLQQRVKDRADVILEQVKNNDGLYDYINVCDDSNNTDDVVNAEMFVLSTSIEPAQGAGKMVQELTIFRKGALKSTITES